VAYDLDEFVAPLLRKLPENVLLRLAQNEPNVEHRGHHLFYLPGKMFEVGHTHFYGVKQFLNLSGFAPSPSLDETQRLVDAIVAALTGLGIDSPRKLTSGIAVFADSPMGKELFARLPKNSDLPERYDGATQYAYLSDRKDWVSAYQIGHWLDGTIFDYDQTACYAWLASRLTDPRELVFWKAESMGKAEQGALFGFIKGKFWIDPGGEYAHCSPIMAHTGNGLYGNPVGALPEDIYTLDEVRYVVGRGIGAFDMTDGWFASRIGGTAPGKPYKDVMERLYELRRGSPMRAGIAKVIANSIVGKLIEERTDGSLGEIRNDVCHALITAGARCEISSFLVGNEIKANELVVVQTDGARLTRRVFTPKHNGMGSWRCNGSDPVLVVSPRKVYTLDKRPYRVTYQNILNMVSGNPKDERWCEPERYRVTLQQAIDDNAIHTVGELRETTVNFELIGLEMEQNRVFNRLPKTGRVLLSGKKYHSEPVIFS